MEKAEAKVAALEEVLHRVVVLEVVQAGPVTLGQAGMSTETTAGAFVTVPRRRAPMAVANTQCMLQTCTGKFMPHKTALHQGEERHTILISFSL